MGVGVLAAWALPILLMLFARGYAAPKPESPSGKGISMGAKTATDAKGKTVPKDVERRKTAKKLDEESKSGMIVRHQLIFWGSIIVPHALVLYFQTGPTVVEQ